MFFNDFRNRNKLFLEALRKKVMYSDMNSFLHEKNGRAFKDFYSVINVSNRVRVETTLQKIKEEMMKFVRNLPLRDDPLEDITYRKKTSSKLEKRKSKERNNDECSFKGELSSSMTSNLLETVSLFIENSDSSQGHNNLKTTGFKVICLVAKSSKFFIEEYFLRLLKLKLFSNNASMMIISFCDTIKTVTPSFLALDDEILIKILRGMKQDSTQKKLECNQYMIKLREKGSRLAPTLNGCITRHKMVKEKHSCGRYFSKQMAKDIIDKFNLKISELEYFSLVKSYFGYIDIDVQEDNLTNVENEKIFEKFPQYSEHLKTIFTECGHTHHRIVTSKNEFERIDYDSYLRFFEEKNLFKSFTYEDISNVNFVNNKAEERLLESVQGKMEIKIQVNRPHFEEIMDSLRQTFWLNSGESPVIKRKKTNFKFNSKINLFSPSKVIETEPKEASNEKKDSAGREKSKTSFADQMSLFVSIPKKTYLKQSTELKRQISLRKSSNFWDSDFTQKGIQISPFTPHYQKKVGESRTAALIYKARWDRFDKTHKYSKLSFNQKLFFTNIPPLKYQADYIKKEQKKKYSQNFLSLKTNGVQAEKILNLFTNLRLLHGFQTSDLRISNKTKTVKFSKGHLIHIIKNNFGNIQVEKKHRMKKAEIFSINHDVSKNDINYFFYSYSIWSKSCKLFLNGNKIFFNRDTLDWENLDSTLINSIGSKNKTADKIFTPSVKKDAFCLSFLIFTKEIFDKKGEDNPKFVQFVKSLNENLSSLTGQESNLVLGKCNQLISNEHLKKREEKDLTKEYLNIEIYEGDYKNSMVVELFWLTANSFEVHRVKFVILSTAARVGLNYSILKCSLSKLFENITLEPCYIIKHLGKEEVPKKIELLKKMGFLEINIKRDISESDAKSSIIEKFQFRSYSASSNLMKNDIEEIGKVGEGGEEDQDILGYMLHPTEFVWVIVRDTGFDIVEFSSGNFGYEQGSGNLDLSEIIGHPKDTTGFKN